MSTSCPYCKLKPSYNKKFKEFSCANKCIVVSLGTLKQSKYEWEYLVEQAIKQEAREMTRKDKKKLQEQKFDDNILKIWRENGVDASKIDAARMKGSELIGIKNLSLPKGFLVDIDPKPCDLCYKNDANSGGVMHLNANELLHDIVSVHKDLPVNNAIASNAVGEHRYGDVHQPICTKIVLHEAQGDPYCDCYYDDNSKCRIYRPDVITYE